MNLTDWSDFNVVINDNEAKSEIAIGFNLQYGYFRSSESYIYADLQYNQEFETLSTDI